MDEIELENNEEEYKEEQQQKKLPLFSCAKISKYFLIPFIVPLFCAAISFIVKKLFLDNGKIDKIKFYLPKIEFITQILGGCLYFIYKKNNQKENQKKSDEIPVKSKHPLIFGDDDNDTEEEKHIKALKIISIISIVELINEEIYAFKTREGDVDKSSFYLIFVVLLSYLISGIKIYFHQKIYLVFWALGLIIVFVSVELYKELSLQIIFEIIYSILYALQICSYKYIMEKFFVSPFLILFVTGSITFFFDFIFNICYNLIYGENIGNIFTNIKFLFNGENMKEYFIIIFILILLVILSVIYYILVMLTLYYFSPFLLVVSDLLCPFLLFLLKLFNNKDFNLLSFIGYLISLVAAIFYNELIVCNFWGLNKNTTENIRKRGQIEHSQSLLDEINNVDESNSSDNEEGREENDGNEEAAQEN